MNAHCICVNGCHVCYNCYYLRIEKTTCRSKMCSNSHMVKNWRARYMQLCYQGYITLFQDSSWGQLKVRVPMGNRFRWAKLCLSQKRQEGNLTLIHVGGKLRCIEIYAFSPFLSRLYTKKEEDSFYWYICAHSYILLMLNVQHTCW